MDTTTRPGSGRIAACALVIVAAVLAAALAMPATALAMTNTRVGSKSQIPMGGVYFDNMGIGNCSISAPGGWWEDATDWSTAGGHPGSAVRILKVSGAGWHASPFTLRWSNGGQTVDGRRVDVVLTCTGVDVGVENGSSDITIGGIYNSVDGDFFSYMASQDSGGSAYCGTSGHGHCWAISYWSWNIVYRGTNTTVAQPFVYIIDDLDFSWNGHDEGIWFSSGFDGASWIKSNCVLGISGNHYYNANNGSDNDFAFNSGAAARTYNGAFSVAWEGRGCSTYVSTSVTQYPTGSVGPLTKASDRGGDAVPAGLTETVTYDITQFVPYAPAAYPTTEVSFSDTLDEVLDAAGAKVSVIKKADEQTGWKDVDVTSTFTVTRSGQTITARANSPRTTAGTLVLRIEAKVRFEADFSGYDTGTWPDGGSYWVFSNVATSRCNTVARTSNDAPSKAWYGSIDLVVDSANDSVSQLGANGCYSLVGNYLLYADEELTQLVRDVWTDEDGHVLVDRVNPGTYYLVQKEEGDGFAHNTTVSIPVVLGLQTTDVAREDVPQSEDMEGRSVASKHDLELMSEGLRHNPLWHLYRDIVSGDGEEGPGGSSSGE